MDWAQYEKERRAERTENRQQALHDYREAAQLANRNNLVLRQCSEVHYQLRAFRDGKVAWLYNLYPGNRRIWQDPRFKGPFLRLPAAWTLTDVVRAVAREQQRQFQNIKPE